jgi:isopenicillin-N epimerase
MNRRDFLVRTGLTLSAGVLVARFPQPRALADGAAPSALDTWDAVRAQFALTRERIHMAGFLLASHPTPVREAIDTHRRGLDENPVEYLHGNAERLEGAVLRAAADYLGVQPTDIALTDSTTMGLGLLYGGLTLHEGQEILTTTHDHYSTAMALQLRATRTGAALRQIPLYHQPATASEEEIIDAVVRCARRPALWR